MAGDEESQDLTASNKESLTPFNKPVKEVEDDARRIGSKGGSAFAWTLWSLAVVAGVVQLVIYHFTLDDPLRDGDLRRNTLLNVYAAIYLVFGLVGLLLFWCYRPQQPRNVPFLEQWKQSQEGNLRASLYGHFAYHMALIQFLLVLIITFVTATAINGRSTAFASGLSFFAGGIVLCLFQIINKSYYKHFREGISDCVEDQTISGNLKNHLPEALSQGELYNKVEGGDLSGSTHKRRKGVYVEGFQSFGVFYYQKYDKASRVCCAAGKGVGLNCYHATMFLVVLFFYAVIGLIVTLTLEFGTPELNSD